MKGDGWVLGVCKCGGCVGRIEVGWKGGKVELIFFVG
jgi:hypothetical protein